jgi:hypothetical protein
MNTRLTNREIETALKNGGLEVVVPSDYVPSSDQDKAAYQEIDFCHRAWRSILLAATGREKVSPQLLDRQEVIQRKRGNAAALSVSVLTVDAARNLQNAGYQLQRPRRN